MPPLELVSVHVPKTGGTSFFAAIRRHYGEALIVDHDHIPGTDHDLTETAQLPSHAKAVHGHFRGDRYRRFLRAFHVTFLRDPVEQFVSNYFFWLTYPPHGNPLHDHLLAERPDIVTYARYCNANLLGGFFGGTDVEALDYVGFADRRAHDYRVLSYILGFHIDADIHENPTVLPSRLEAKRMEIETSPRILCELRDVLRRDYFYYERFRARWA